jgi:hypothetical protein
MDKNKVIENKSIVDELAKVSYVLKRTAKWAPEKYFINGNHERFYKDFVEKYPQLSCLVNFAFLSSVVQEGFQSIELKGVLELGDLTIVHGDMIMFGQKGSKLEKNSRNFGTNCIIGHIHYPAIRLNAYSIGLAGELDQDYNEVNASKWASGFALCNQWKGESFISTFFTPNYQVDLGGKSFTPIDPASWKNIPKYEASLDFSFSEKE